jgi:hypothetical protein
MNPDYTFFIFNLLIGQKIPPVTDPRVDSIEKFVEIGVPTGRIPDNCSFLKSNVGKRKTNDATASPKKNKKNNTTSEIPPIQLFFRKYQGSKCFDID